MPFSCHDSHGLDVEIGPDVCRLVTHPTGMRRLRGVSRLLNSPVLETGSSEIAERSERGRTSVRFGRFWGGSASSGQIEMPQTRPGGARGTRRPAPQNEKAAISICRHRVQGLGGGGNLYSLAGASELPTTLLLFPAQVMLPSCLWGRASEMGGVLGRLSSRQAIQVACP